MREPGQSRIQLDHVSRVFLMEAVETHAPEDITLDILVGSTSRLRPSGCGKSTLLSILGLLDTPTEGTYTLNCQPVAQLAQADRF